jgi:Raf kinase inhibitor-like YbhB/YbcL family protein
VRSATSTLTALRSAAALLLTGALLAGCGTASTSGSTSRSVAQATTASTPATGSTATATTATASTGTAAAPTTSPASGGAGLTTTVARPPGVPPGRPLASGLSLSSSAFHNGGAIPSNYTCDGQDLSLPLQWSGVPAGTSELVLVMRDPDATTSDFVHWALAGIPAAPGSFQAGGVSGHVIPGRNSFGALGYRGPCPPTGARAHHYVLTLTALGGPSGLGPGFTPDQLHTGALAIATLVGTYGRP